MSLALRTRKELQNLNEDDATVSTVEQQNKHVNPLFMAEKRSQACKKKEQLDNAGSSIHSSNKHHLQHSVYLYNQSLQSPRQQAVDRRSGTDPRQSRLFSSYNIVSQVGSGSFGVVHQAIAKTGQNTGKTVRFIEFSWFLKFLHF